MNHILFIHLSIYLHALGENGCNLCKLLNVNKLIYTINNTKRDS